MIEHEENNVEAMATLFSITMQLGTFLVNTPSPSYIQAFFFLSPSGNSLENVRLKLHQQRCNVTITMSVMRQNFFFYPCAYEYSRGPGNSIVIQSYCVGRYEQCGPINLVLTLVVGSAFGRNAVHRCVVCLYRGLPYHLGLLLKNLAE